MLRLGNMVPRNVGKGANLKVQIQRPIVFKGLGRHLHGKIVAAVFYAAIKYSVKLYGFRRG